MGPHGALGPWGPGTGPLGTPGTLGPWATGALGPGARASWGLGRRALSGVGSPRRHGTVGLPAAATADVSSFRASVPARRAVAAVTGIIPPVRGLWFALVVELGS